MLKNLTLSAEEALIEKARAKALSEKTTLEEEIRRWLEEYAREKRKANSALRNSARRWKSWLILNGMAANCRVMN